MKKGMEAKEQDAKLVSDFYDLYNLAGYNLKESLTMLSQKHGMEDDCIYRRIFRIKENENLYNSLLQSKVTCNAPQDAYSQSKQAKTFKQLQDEYPEELARLQEQNPTKFDSMFNDYISGIK